MQDLETRSGTFGKGFGDLKGPNVRVATPLTALYIHPFNPFRFTPVAIFCVYSSLLLCFLYNSTLRLSSILEMGNWNRRYIPRKKYRYDYQDPPPSPQLHTSEFKGGSMPSWEINYCNCQEFHGTGLWLPKSISTVTQVWPSGMVLPLKRHSTTQKRRYWATINGVPCENPLPDPDMYIDEIDWNPYIDPELVLDLDRQFFNPDKLDKDDKLEVINEEVETVLGCAKEKDDKNQSNNDNPWERNQSYGAENLINVKHGCGQCDNFVNLKNVENPWEQSPSEVDVSAKNGWRLDNDLWGWGWNVGLNETTGQPAVTTSGNPWNSCCERQDAWGDRENTSWGLSPGNTTCQDSWNSRNPSENISKGGRYSRDRSRRKYRNESWDRKQSEYQSSKTRYWDSSGGYRKRESSPQHASRYKSSRYRGDLWGTVNNGKRQDI